MTELSALAVTSRNIVRLSAAALFAAIVLLRTIPAQAQEVAPWNEMTVPAASTERLFITAAVPRSWPPHYSTNDSGAPEGFAIEMMNEVARIANVEVRYRIYDSFGQTSDALEAKEVDVIPNTGITDFRKEYSLFTPPLETFQVLVHVRSGMLSGTQRQEAWLDILKGRRTAVVLNNIGQLILKDRPEVPTVLYHGPHEAVMDLIAGSVDALVYPGPVISRIVGSVGLTGQIDVVGTPLGEVKRGIAVRVDYPELHKRLTAAVNTFVKSEKYDEIYSRWFDIKKVFWTTGRQIIFIGVPTGLLVVMLIFWRYLSVTSLNYRLQESRKSLADLNAELESKVLGRTREISLEKQRAESYLDISGTMILILERTGRITQINDSGCRILGCEPGEGVGLDWFASFVPLQNQNEAKADFAKDMTRPFEGVRKQESVAISRDGSLRTIAWRMRIILDESGTGTGMLCSGEDVTEARISENMYRTLSHQNETILNAAGDGIYGIDKNGITTFVNTAAARMLGYEAAELVGQPIHELIFRGAGGRVTQASAQSAINTAVQFGETVNESDGLFWTYDGNSFPVEYTATSIGSLDDPSGAVIIFRDVTDKRNIQAQLIQSSKLATLGEMATGVAHELNQPLNVIAMASANIARKAEKGEIDTAYLRKKLDRIIAQTRRAADIIDHMRVFGRRTSGQKELIDIPSVARSALNLIGEQLRQANIDVSIEIMDSCGPVNGHAVQMEQVLLNVLVNARDALKENRPIGERFVNITIDAGANGKSVRLVVADNAGGISPEIRDRIFEPFFTTKEIGQGTGLGLSISYGIISDMGGTIGVNDNGAGTDFVIELPIA